MTSTTTTIGSNNRVTCRWKKVILYIPLTILIVERLCSIGQLHERIVGTLDYGVLDVFDGSYSSSLRQFGQRYDGVVPLHSLSFITQKYDVGNIPLNQLVTNQGEYEQCPSNQHYVQDQHLPYEQVVVPTDSYNNNNKRIPNIIHQTSKSRCVTERIYNATWHWSTFGTGGNHTSSNSNSNNNNDDSWAYYFHTDTAMDALFYRRDWSDVFPQLTTVLLSCTGDSGTMKADLWRYLVLWEYGGVYADIDTVPVKFSPTTIGPTDDAFFVVEQYHLLSQYFMATSPKHPIMFYTIHEAIARLLSVDDLGNIRIPTVTGPHALNRGFQQFMKDVGVVIQDAGVAGNKPVRAGRWVGTDGRSITVRGIGENENEYVSREYIKRGPKLKDYRSMNMTHFTQHKLTTSNSCIQQLWKERQGRKSKIIPRSATSAVA